MEIPQEYEDQPRSLRNLAEIERRLRMLDTPHMQSLKKYVRKLRNGNLGEIAEFDPLDGGVNAEILFLFEKPGPMTANNNGSGFISRNNDDPTAENTFNIMKEIGIPRGITCTWNVIPGWNGTTRVTSQERAKGAEFLGELLGLLEKLKIIILVGKTAQKAKKLIENMEDIQNRKIKVRTSYHPANRVKYRYRKYFDTIKYDWRNAYYEL